MKILVLVVVKIICKKIEYFVFSNFYTFYKFLSILVILDLSEFFIWKKFLYFFWKIVFVFIFFWWNFLNFYKKNLCYGKKFRQKLEISATKFLTFFCHLENKKIWQKNYTHLFTPWWNWNNVKDEIGSVLWGVFFLADCLILKRTGIFYHWNRLEKKCTISFSEAANRPMA